MRIPGSGGCARRPPRPARCPGVRAPGPEGNGAGGAYGDRASGHAAVRGGSRLPHRDRHHRRLSALARRGSADWRPPATMLLRNRRRPFPAPGRDGRHRLRSRGQVQHHARRAGWSCATTWMRCGSTSCSSSTSAARSGRCFEGTPGLEAGMVFHMYTSAEGLESATRCRSRTTAANASPGRPDTCWSAGVRAAPAGDGLTEHFCPAA